MTKAILQVTDLCKSFGGIRVTDGVNLDVAPGKVHALIGPNGAGKTTLINQLSGLLQPDSGNISFAGLDVTGIGPSARAKLGLARSFQITSVLPRFSVLENVSLAVQSRKGSSYRFFGNASAEMHLNRPAIEALEEVGLEHRASELAVTLSHGEKRALELAMALAMKPKLLLLDEPMAGTGPEETDKLVGTLMRLRGRLPMLLVEHDMDAVFALADTVSVLIYGRVLVSGPPQFVREHPEVISAYLGEEDD